MVSPRARKSSRWSVGLSSSPNASLSKDLLNSLAAFATLRSWPDGSRSSTLRVGWKAGPAPLHVHQDWTSSSHRTCAIARAVLFGLEKSTPELKSYVASVPSGDNS